MSDECFITALQSEKTSACVRSRSALTYFAQSCFVLDVNECDDVIWYCLIFLLSDSRSWTLLGVQDRWKKQVCTPDSDCWVELPELDRSVSVSTSGVGLSSTIHSSWKHRILQSSYSVCFWRFCRGTVVHYILSNC